MTAVPGEKPDDGIYGDAYISLMDANPESRQTRLGFQELATSLAKPGSAIFDFGAGPGVDARHYAERGFEVIAYDNDPRMADSFLRHCAPELQAGKIRLYQGEYREFLSNQVGEIRQRHSIGLITANFAPLNLIPDLAELFAAFDLLCAEGGRVLVSVLNPWFIGDLRYRWWWSHRLEYARRGEFAVPGAKGPIWRRSARQMAMAAAPAFKLTAVMSGRPRRDAHDLRSMSGLSSWATRYWFMSFEKSASP